MPDKTYETTLRLSDLHRTFLIKEPQMSEPTGGWVNLMLEKAMLIVVGTWIPAEIVDRFCAYELVEEIESKYRMKSALVITDREWWNIREKLSGVPVISVGGPVANSLSADLAKKLELRGIKVGESASGIAPRDLDSRVMAYVWGHDARATLTEVENFISRGGVRDWLRAVEQAS